MAEVTFAQVYEMVKQLPRTEQQILVERVQEDLHPVPDYGITAEELDAELVSLRASGAFEDVKSLYGAFANPAVDLSEETMNADLHKIGTEWEAEMTELAGNDER
jgi:hypothetical protein